MVFESIDPAVVTTTLLGFEVISRSSTGMSNTVKNTRSLDSSKSSFTEYDTNFLGKWMDMVTFVSELLTTSTDVLTPLGSVIRWRFWISLSAQVKLTRSPFVEISEASKFRLWTCVLK